MFDFWGTLAYLEQGEDFGQVIANSLKISKKEYAQLVLDNWFINNISSEEFAKLLVKKSNVLESEILHIANLIESPISRARLFSDVKSSLNRLKVENNLYLISDTSSIGERSIDLLNVRSYFNGIFLSNRYGVTKKNGLFKKAFEELGGRPDDYLVIGDSVESDYLVPRSLAARSILIDRAGVHNGFDSIRTLEELK